MGLFLRRRRGATPLVILLAVLVLGVVASVVLVVRSSSGPVRPREGGTQQVSVPQLDRDPHAPASPGQRIEKQAASGTGLVGDKGDAAISLSAAEKHIRDVASGLLQPYTVDAAEHLRLVLELLQSGFDPGSIVVDGDVIHAMGREVPMELTYDVEAGRLSLYCDTAVPEGLLPRVHAVRLAFSFHPKTNLAEGWLEYSPESDPSSQEFFRMREQAERASSYRWRWLELEAEPIPAGVYDVKATVPSVSQDGLVEFLTCREPVVYMEDYSLPGYSLLQEIHQSVIAQLDLKSRFPDSFE